MSDTDFHQLSLLDDDTIAELRDIMEDDFDDLVRTFLDDLPGQLTAIDAAASQAAAEVLYRSAHKLKSGSGSIGAPRLAEIARQLEIMGRNGDLSGAQSLVAQLHAAAAATETGFRELLG